MSLSVFFYAVWFFIDTVAPVVVVGRYVYISLFCNREGSTCEDCEDVRRIFALIFPLIFKLGSPVDIIL